MQALAGELGVGRNTLYRWFRDASLDPGKLRDS
jgi:transposase-like protein